MKHTSRTLRLVLLASVILCLMVSSRSPLAQNQTAGIVGVVSDSGGAVIPNAKVAITSSALQVHDLSTTTDSQGNYKFVDLPAPGVYRISFSAKGFNTLVQDGINLTVGFTAKIDPVLKIGEITQVVEVTSSGPVVDTVSTAGTATLQQTDIQEAPKGLGLQWILRLRGRPRRTHHYRQALVLWWL